MLPASMPSASKEASMRQAMLVLALAIGSPLTMAQSATGAVTPAAAPQHGPAVAANASPARKPLSPIGRALADLLGAANQQRAQAQAGANANAGIDAASRARLAAETEHDSVP
jgi:hypothetical protein